MSEKKHLTQSTPPSCGSKRGPEFRLCSGPCARPTNQSAPCVRKEQLSSPFLLCGPPACPLSIKHHHRPRGEEQTSRPACLPEVQHHGCCVLLEIGDSRWGGDRGATARMTKCSLKMTKAVTHAKWSVHVARAHLLWTFRFCKISPLAGLWPC